MSSLLLPAGNPEVPQPKQYDAPDKWLNYIGNAYPLAPVGALLLGRLSDQLSIGWGRSKITYDYEPGKVVSLFKKQKDPDHMKAIYYRRNLVNLFLPEYLPRVHAAAAYPGRLILEKAAGITADRLLIEGPLEFEGELIDVDVKSAIRETMEAFETRGLEVDDNRRENFVITPSGAAVYVDGLSWHHYGLDYFEKSVGQLSPARQSAAVRLLRRIKTLPEPLDF